MTGETLVLCVGGGGVHAQVSCLAVGQKCQVPWEMKGAEEREREMLGSIRNECVMETVGDGDWVWSTTLYIP